jgi:hypothetical protein
MAVYALTIFTGAFLLFQVQPLIGKYILPWFGGGPGVWTTCLLFFQVLLLGGYAYAHWISERLKPRAQAVAHLALLAAALALLPITPNDSWKPSGQGNPTLQILALLGASLGLPYFVLSATGPLMQHWFSRTHPGRSPYRLYALSNAGSLLALVSYPFLFEPHLTRRAQSCWWGWGLAAYALCCALCAATLWRAQTEKADPTAPGAADPTPCDAAPTAPQAAANPSALRCTFYVLRSAPLLWLLLPACASVLLLATTNKLCQDVAVIPFLWVLPLGLYLLSFIICFDSPRWYLRPLLVPALAAVLAGVCWALFRGPDLSIYKQVAIYSGGLFIACMVCHGELYRLRPDPRRLTGFYLMVAAGGALGGVLVAVVAPLVFKDYYELHCGLVLCGLLIAGVCARERRYVTTGLLTLGVAALAVVLWHQVRNTRAGAVFKTRNFYGVMTVYEYNHDDPKSRYYLLLHGRITHGMQFADPERSRWPTSYYGPDSGIGRAVLALPPEPRRIGVVGLGTGTLTALGRAGDYFRIYEINPQVCQVATHWFHYLSQSPGQVEVALGDARLSMEKEPPQRFDLLALDAFSSDSIPVHLLTKEAFQVYERHLAPNGIIAVHVSNHYLNLQPVVANLARQFGYQAAVIDYVDDDVEYWLYSSTWMLLCRSEDVLGSAAISELAYRANTNATKIPLWTDDFASLFQILQ